MNQKNAMRYRGHGTQGGSQDVLRSNSEISRKLKTYYSELVSDDIPDRFRSLLQELEMRKQAGNSADTDQQ